MAAIGPERWPVTLERIAEAFDGRQVTLRPDDIATIDIRYDVGHIFMKSCVQDFAASKPFVQPVARLSTGAQATAVDILGPAQYGHGECCDEPVLPRGCRAFVAARSSCGGSILSGIAVLRGSRMFDAAERDLGARLSSHLRRAIQVHRELRAARRGRDGTVEALIILRSASCRPGPTERCCSPTPSLQRC
ncbi:hypothetical protein D3273_15770 [Lichenibacterium minor]|uniref:Uncharacterized protein n=1 Tax=Lichenibacterium minor TaxID=2316528 RepID=A0A4Q2U3T8_9HYPH|nr:hypothetical protein [Lichenibacterium minor]RYC30992.1 hypothetical protein D3273_15770 [Lichenibacterium minor]